MSVKHEFETVIDMQACTMQSAGHGSRRSVFCKGSRQEALTKQYAVCSGNSKVGGSAVEMPQVKG
jgi:hypothetical protein